jgi:hypothetical protein
LLVIVSHDTLPIMKKGCLIVLAVGVVLSLIGAAVVFFVFRLTAPLVTEGEKFLNTAGNGSPEAAYAMASATLRNGQTQEDFARAIQKFGLKGYESASWSNRNISNDRGVLEGTAHTQSGGSVPLTLELIKEGETWKVLSIKGPQPGASSGPIIAKEDAPQAVPSSEEANRMVLASLLAFNEALQAKSFETFHAGISNLWQEQITPAKLLEVFKPFIDAEINLAPIKPLTPVFKSPPAINEDGVLILEGDYPTEPSKVYFTLKYVSENKAWKLIGVNVNVK